MRGGQKLPLIFGILLSFLMVTGKSTPAYATPDDLGYLWQVIMGTPGGLYPGIYKILTPVPNDPSPLGIASQAQMPGIITPPNSLIGYFEEVYWPRMIELFKAQTAQNGAMLTALQSMSNRMAEAGKQVDWKMRQDQMKVQSDLGALGRTESICSRPSMGQSELAWQFLTQQIREQNMVTATDEVTGDVSKPEFKSPVQYALTMLPKRNQLGVCNKTGNAGADEKWCTNGTAARKGFDLSPEGLLGKPLIQTDDPNALNYMPYVDLYIANMFPDRAFTAIGAAKLNPPSPEAAEVLTDRAAFNAQTLTFMKPFVDAKSERTGIPDAKALVPLQAALQRAGYGEQQAKNYIAQNVISLAAMQNIRYKVYYHDPATVINEVAGPAGINQGNAMAVQIATSFDQVTLLYDIREEMKKTNVLLGALGSVLNRAAYDEIESKAASLTDTK